MRKSKFHGRIGRNSLENITISPTRADYIGLTCSVAIVNTDKVINVLSFHFSSLLSLFSLAACFDCGWTHCIFARQNYKSLVDFRLCLCWFHFYTQSWTIKLKASKKEKAKLESKRRNLVSVNPSFRCTDRKDLNVLRRLFGFIIGCVIQLSLFYLTNALPFHCVLAKLNQEINY